MRRCLSCGGDLHGGSALCPHCDTARKRKRRHRVIRTVWIGAASLLTVAGIALTWSYVLNPPPLFFSDSSSSHSFFVNRWTLLFGWDFLLFVWKTVPWKDGVVGDP